MKFTVNGKSVQATQKDETVLLWFLREQLGLTGTRYSCGKGVCGSCTVHVDGKPQRSCVTQVSSLKGKSVTTIEGLNGPLAQKLQQAWEEVQVPQCGYCQSGQIMQAATLFTTKNKGKISRDDIIKHMDANLCRCGTYARILKAIETVAKQV